MNPLTTHSHYDAHIDIDQCPICGGLWFDDLELYTIKQGLANVIEEIDRKKLRTVVPSASKLLCPRDGTPLVSFKDQNFPLSIQVESCSKCRGLWFNRSEFKEWQAAREKKKKTADKAGARKAEDERFDMQIDKLLVLHNMYDTDDTLKKLDDFMATTCGIQTVKQTDSESPEVERAARTISLANDLIALVKKPSPDSNTPAEEREKIVAQAKILNAFLKILAATITLYFIISEARIALGTKILHSDLDFYIWYFQILTTFVTLPSLYLFKLLDYFDIHYIPGLRSTTRGYNFLQAKMFYYVIYVILLMLSLARLFN